MDKALNYMALARKAGRIELGEEPVGAAARAQHAYLIAVASDASDHSWRRALSFVANTNQKCVRVPFTKDQLGQAIGRTSLAIAAFTDPALALAFAKSLPPTAYLTAVIESLTERTARIRQRQNEQQARKRNKAIGKRKKN